MTRPAVLGLCASYLALGAALIVTALLEYLTRPRVTPDPALAEDSEVAALDAIWELPARTPPHEAAPA